MPAEALGWVQWPDYKMRWVMLPTLWKKDYLGLFPAVLHNPHVTQDESLKFNFLLFTCLKKSESRVDNFLYSIPIQIINALVQDCSSFMWRAKCQVSKALAPAGASCFQHNTNYSDYSPPSSAKSLPSQNLVFHFLTVPCCCPWWGESYVFPILPIWSKERTGGSQLHIPTPLPCLNAIFFPRRRKGKPIIDGSYFYLRAKSMTFM